MNNSRDCLIEVKNLKMYFERSSGFIHKQTSVVKAVDDVNLGIYPGETFGLVGESGCGKSTCGLCIVRLYEPTGGEIMYKGQDITHLNAKEMLPYRQNIQMIFQDPFASLNPRMTVSDIITEPLVIHNLHTGRGEREKILHHLLDMVGLSTDHASRYPHEFSGGQLQRVGIARALAIEPEFIVCDEPISALDVSIQAQVVNMLEDLQKELGLTYLFIAHDLSMVRHISNRVGVMYLGSLVEVSETEELYEKYKHPYTEALLTSVPLLDPIEGKRTQFQGLGGEIPSPTAQIIGCKFAARCKYATDLCRKEAPVLKDLGSEHYVSCHHPLTQHDTVDC